MFARLDIFLSLILIIAAFGVFANSLRGDFVYDDNRQILMNPLIQDSKLYIKALFSDVWAFKGDGNIATSNYWRPTFVAWMILNFKLFGTSPFGWHLANVLLHTFICLLTFFLLYKRWNVDLFLAFAISLLFAVHPVHVESVTWISGAPDLLATAFMLLSLWFASKKEVASKKEYILLSVFFYALAVGAKEIILPCFLVYYPIFRYFQKESKLKAVKLTLPFLAVGILYFIIRYKVLGVFSLKPEDAIELKNAILAIPTVFLFYLKQLIYPVNLCANYSIKLAENILMDFVTPSLISLSILSLMFILARRSSLQKLGLFLFLLPLLPVMNLSLFSSEQLVHDRYLYLPLLGFLILILPSLTFLKLDFRNFTKLNALILAITALLLGLKTISYSQVWLSDLSLWEYQVKANENSAFGWAQYGAKLLELEKFSEAENAYNRSIQIKPSTIAFLGRGRSLIGQGKFDSAIEDLKKIIETPDENLYLIFQAYGALAIAYSGKKEPEKALEVLLQARNRLPIYYASLTVKIAIVLYQMNRKQEALNQLEAVKERAKTELMPESKSVFFRLGLLYAEMGKKAEAKANLLEFLRLSNNFRNKITEKEREIALDYLKKLS